MGRRTWIPVRSQHQRPAETPGAQAPAARHGFRRTLSTLTLALLALVLLPHPGQEAQAAEKLTPANASQLSRSDQRGFNWDLNVQGVIRDGTNDCFDGAMSLKVNRGAYGSNQAAMQTKSGEELVLQGALGDIAITRRVRLDPALGAVRYVEHLHNKSKKTVTVAVEVTTRLGSSAQTVRTSAGRGFTGGTLEKAETGLIAVHAGGSRPGVLFQLTTPKGQHAPRITVQSNRTFKFTWNLTIAGGQNAAVLHSIAQRRWNGPPLGQPLLDEFKPLLTRTWTADLPKSVRNVLLNHRGVAGASATMTSATSAGDAIKEIAKAYDVDRGEAAVLFIEKDKPLNGSVEGEDFVVETRLGATEVAFEDVAILQGGANMGRSMRIYLRRGEVLSGHVRSKGLRFATKAGLEIALDPAGVDALFLPAAAEDGGVPLGVEAFLTQLDGTTLAMGPSKTAKLRTVTPWGDLAIPLSAVVRIEYHREPVPGLWILLLDGTKAPVAVGGGALRLTSKRFGAIDVEPGSMASWVRHGAQAAVATGPEGEGGFPPTTHANVAGDCYLLGTMTGERLHIETLAGLTPVFVTQIRVLERNDDGDDARPSFDVTLKTGEKLSGVLRERMATLKTPYGICRMPVIHLLNYRWFGPAKKAAPPAKDEANGAEATGDAPKKAPKKSAPKKAAGGGK